MIAHTVRLSPQNAARWHLENTVLRASLIFQADRVARKLGVTVVLIDPETEAELYRAVPS